MEPHYWVVRLQEVILVMEEVEVVEDISVVEEEMDIVLVRRVVLEEEEDLVFSVHQ
jgi:hypothetical protein